MYKWPQGKIIRVLALCLVCVIAADLGFFGAFPQFVIYSEGSGVRSLVIGCIYGALALAALIAGLIAIGFKPVSVDFLIDVEYEMARVTWPTTNELVRATIVIALLMVFLGVSIFAVDWFNLEILFKNLYGVGK